ncbi:MAG: polyphosphate kinase 1 [Longimicrobiales bacterium]
MSAREREVAGDVEPQVAAHAGPLLPVAVSPQAVSQDGPLSQSGLYFNRELSWLDFNWRVLYQALDTRTPLLERARFLAITQSNLDEFFAKRVGGLKSLLAAGVSTPAPDGRTPSQQLELVWSAAVEMQRRMCAAWREELRPQIQEAAGITVVEWSELTDEEQAQLLAHFRSNIYPILTPLGVDPGHPFPFISNLSLSMAIALAHPTRGTEHFARLKIPLNRGRWIRLGTSRRYLAIETLIAQHMGELFRGMEVRSTHLFRVTRNAELEWGGDEAEDLLQMISEELRERRFAPVVRLEVQQGTPAAIRDLLVDELEIEPHDVYEIDGLLDLTSLNTFADLEVPELHFPPWEPVTPFALLNVGRSQSEPDMFSVIRNGDVLVHHPYESFAASVERFVEEAAADRRVLALKQTLYRVSDDSRVARALIRAAEAGKQVAVLVEVTASLDEQRNMDWAQRMEEAGVHVTYGVVGLKTHTKITLVVREEPDAIRTYCHVGTGNYHERTARLYTDLGLFTASPEIGGDVVNLFHFLTGLAPAQQYTHLLVAPRDMRQTLLRLIDEEVARGEQGRIILKMNGIDDVGMIEALYRASRAGVRIDLIVRAHSRLRPQLPGFSEHIRLISIVGRFLEHDRIWYFHNGGQPRVYIGSADWRRRNLEERVEAMVRIDDGALQNRLYRLLDAALNDNRSAWELRADGRYLLRQPPTDGPVRWYQELLMQQARESQPRAHGRTGHTDER